MTTLRSAKLEELDKQISEAQDRFVNARTEADAKVNELQAQIRQVELDARKEIDGIQKELGDLRGAHYTEHRRLVGEACNACVIEANELACDVDNAYAVHDNLRERLAAAVRGTIATDWAEDITDALEHRQQFGGFTYGMLLSLTNVNGRSLTDKQAQRAWEILEDVCPKRGMTNTDFAQVMLGTPYPIYRTENGLVCARLS